VEMRSWGTLPSSSSLVLLLVLKPDRTQFSRTRDHAENEHNSAYLFRHRIPAARSRMRTNARARALKSVDLHCEEENRTRRRMDQRTSAPRQRRNHLNTSTKALTPLAAINSSSPLGLTLLAILNHNLAVSAVPLAGLGKAEDKYGRNR
jgi:hypothetical protein